MRATSVLLITGIALGCEAEAGPSDLVDKMVAVRDHMHARYAATANIRIAIALGDLPRAHEEARVIATLDEPDVLPEWQPYVDNIRAAATQIELTTNTVAAARTLAALGKRCASCHEAAGAKIVFPKVPPPAADAKLPSQMAGHQWATARMWEGVIGPAPALWLAGATALSRARLTVAAESGELGIADDIARVRLLATRALKVKTSDDRAQLYGELLGTCAHCHFTIRDR